MKQQKTGGLHPLMSPAEKWEAAYESSREHIGKTKEELMNREQLIKYVHQLKTMIRNIQSANVQAHPVRR